MSPGPALLSDHLRAETAQAHARLEDRLDLLQPRPDKARFAHLLKGFYGFHLAWEPAMAAHPAGALIGRDRTALLQHDLATLGVPEAEWASVQPWTKAAGLAAEPQAALGSAYVVEGSTLGGQLIARALVDAPWRPTAGLRYFDPYGRETGARWRAFKAALDATPRETWPLVVDGARATFALLADNLAPAVDTLSEEPA